MKKKLLCLFCSILLCVPLVACGHGAKYYLSYYDQTDPEKGFDQNLFYINDMPAACADPTCIYIDDKNNPEDDGWFFMYPTSNVYGSMGNVCYRSRDMKSWEYVGAIFEPTEDSWMAGRLWAPEVVYDKETQKYYLFESAQNTMPAYNKYKVVFYSYEDKETWYSAADEIEAMVASVTKAQAVPVLWDYIQDRQAVLEAAVAGETAADGKIYTEERLQAAVSDIKLLDSKLFKTWNDDNTEQVISTEEGIRLNTNYDVLMFGAICATAAEVYAMESEDSFGLCVAVSDSPRGPFKQYTNIPDAEGYDPDNRTITMGMPFVAPEDIYKWLMNRKSEYWEDFKNGTSQDMQDVQNMGGQVLKRESVGFRIIDAHPYLDPVSGKKYLYASVYHDANDGGVAGSFIFGVELGERWTDDPKWETLTRLTRVDYYTPNDLSESNKATDLNEGGGVNEGPYLYHKNGKYYLTYSVNSWTSKKYATIQAIGDTPLGPFRKLTLAEGGKILGSELHWDHVGGPGHHSFCEYDGELFIIYHSHYDRVNIDGITQRGSCFDQVVWTKNADGLDIMHVNGPTYSVQPKYGVDRKYKNIAADATIKASNTAKDSDVKYLNDGIIKFYSWDEFIHEFESGKGKKTTITLTFDDYRTIKALMVYNTFDYEKHWKEIEKVEFDALKEVKGKEQKITAVIDKLKFDAERYINEAEEDMEFMRPGGAAIAEFDELKVKEIRITLKHKTPIAISEIYVLGL